MKSKAIEVNQERERIMKDVLTVFGMASLCYVFVVMCMLM